MGLGTMIAVLMPAALAGQPGERVNVLSTYPDPGRHSLMVRHAGPSSLFAAVHEAYFDAPVAEAETCPFS